MQYDPFTTQIIRTLHFFFTIFFLFYFNTSLVDVVLFVLFFVVFIFIRLRSFVSRGITLPIKLFICLIAANSGIECLLTDPDLLRAKKRVVRGRHTLVGSIHFCYAHALKVNVYKFQIIDKNKTKQKKQKKKKINIKNGQVLIIIIIMDAPKVMSPIYSSRKLQRIKETK